jgi:4-amino-4-deoxy-L-arabinose transferase-like glycosyltransferase
MKGDPESARTTFFTVGGDGRFLAVLCLMALMIRAVFILMSDGHTMGDSDGYITYADSLLRDGTFIDSGHSLADRAPGYSFFLLPFVLLFGMEGGFLLKAICLAQSALGVAMIPLAFEVAYRHRGLLAARLLAVLLAFNPFFVFYGKLILTEIMSVIFSILILWLLDRSSKAPRVRDAVWIGLAFGVAHLIKPYLALFFGVAVGYHYWRAEKSRSLHWRVAVAVLTFILVLLPWGARNQIVFGRPLVNSTQGGLVLYAGNNPLNRSGGGIVMVDYREPAEALELQERRQALAAAGLAGSRRDLGHLRELAALEDARNDLLKERAMRWIRDHPGRFLRLAVLKASRLWNPVLHAPEFRKPYLMIISALYMIPVLIFAIVGMAGSRRRLPGPLLFAAFMILGVTLLHMVMIGSIRYREPVMAYVCLFAAFGADDLVKRLRKG